MKTILMACALAATLTCNAQAQSVTASTRVLEFEPVAAGEVSPVTTVVFTNHGDVPIDVYGMGWNSPFRFGWTCSDGRGITLPVSGTCTVEGVFAPPAQQPPGLVETIMGFRISTGTELIGTRGFTYSRHPIEGLRNLQASLQPLGVAPDAQATLQRLLKRAEFIMLDGNSSNDKRACAPLGQFTTRVVHEAARDRLSDWSAVALGAQQAAVSNALHCKRG